MLGKGMLLRLAVSMVVTIITGLLILPKLKGLLIGQSIREEGPKSHYKKEGTPTIGGIIFLSGWLISALIFRELDKMTGFILMSGFAFGFLGFLDDYIKVIKKRNLGLTAKQKLMGQILISLAMTLFYIRSKGLPFSMKIPFTETGYWELGIIGIFFYLFVIVGTVNAVNLTDGLDGLSSGVMVFCLLFFAIAANRLELASISGIVVLLIGSLLGFLYFNSYPARVFMGDTGSLALGGALAAIALLMDLTLFIPIAGAIFVIETLSVIIQVFSFKVFGKRVFKMSPLHHHFEQCGWHEKSVVKLFYVMGIIFLIIAVLGFQA